jgi:hypothetical protein
MQIYIFRSETNELHAFVGDSTASKLPARFGPWLPEGIVKAGETLPYNLSRFNVESAIKLHGFQLWRKKEPIAAETQSSP